MLIDSGEKPAQNIQTTQTVLALILIEISIINGAKLGQPMTHVTMSIMGQKPGLNPRLAHFNILSMKIYPTSNHT